MLMSLLLASLLPTGKHFGVELVSISLQGEVVKGGKVNIWGRLRWFNQTQDFKPNGKNQMSFLEFDD